MVVLVVPVVPACAGFAPFSRAARRAIRSTPSFAAARAPTNESRSLPQSPLSIQASGTPIGGSYERRSATRTRLVLAACSVTEAVRKTGRRQADDVLAYLFDDVPDVLIAGQSLPTCSPSPISAAYGQDQQLPDLGPGAAQYAVPILGPHTVWVCPTLLLL
ncbi:uncharacterized protein B0I36DRAFT_356320 [Microdochium trichocladiopsis]|uniref:Uncharacterized protein n=1 Tax=Microdochium trichocladiopsis TaxID=1682393 RepID=A0A9P9BL22_9PEZI|nr:uncharacterized protein B0I36DRAFT_356320 [Microdochium trichocladiopsis]KAH7012243.1 hypothetical protein B0I36DRAFT_356320 [Microdochium trichocladiopsis]